MVRGVKSHVESNPICTRDAQRAQTKPCVHQDPEAPQTLSQTYLWVFEYLLQRQGSAAACHRGRGSGCCRTGPYSGWHKPSWRRVPLTPPSSCQADDPETAEQLHEKTAHTVKKVLGPPTDFTTWAFGKGTENPKGIWLWRPVGFDYRNGKTDSWRAQTKPYATRNQEKGTDTPQETDPDFLWVFRCLWQRQR